MVRIEGMTDPREMVQRDDSVWDKNRPRYSHDTNRTLERASRKSRRHDKLGISVEIRARNGNAGIKLELDTTWNCPDNPALIAQEFRKILVELGERVETILIDTYGDACDRRARRR
jgi:hypothetical protein